MQRSIRRRMTLGVAIGSRAFFSPAPCKAARDEILAELAALGVDAVILPFEATENGAVQSIADADLMPSTSASTPTGSTGSCSACRTSATRSRWPSC